ncbi:MAG: ABC transporter permease subunit [Clostridia bacterium]|nr:ABC transporter permease subunit [Deltaproteobacteria bacterium]
MSELSLAGSRFRARRRSVDRFIGVACAAIAATTFIGLLVAVVLTVGRGLADIGGVLARKDQAFAEALWGSASIALTATLFSVVIGVGTTIYMCEIAGNPIVARRFVAVARALAALPAVVFGIIGMQLVMLVETHYLVVATMTLSLLALPRIIVNTRDALNKVPVSARMASYALGATPWRTMRDHILPVAVRNIASGVFATVGRTFGATAPLVMLAAVTPMPATLPTEAVHAILFGDRTNSELAGAVIAVIVMIHAVVTFFASQLQRRFEVVRL